MTAATIVDPEGAAVVSERVTSAEAARAEWARSAGARSGALHGWADDIELRSEALASLVVAEVSKPIFEARAEIARAVAILRYYAQLPYDSTGEVYPSTDGRARLITERVPLGTVAIVTPWNFPVAIPVWKAAPALAYGNAVLFKPSSAARGVAREISALAEHRFPAAVLQCVPTDRIGTDILLDDHRVAGVSFTGSVDVGRHVVQRVSRRGAPVQAEMGGQNASIVLDDADQHVAARVIAGAAMGYAGQKCTATRRVLVHRRIADDFMPILIAEVEALAVGDPRAEATVVGPLITERSRQDVAAAVLDAIERGAQLLTGGDRPNLEGPYYQPTLVHVTDPADPIAQEELFGPVASVLVFGDDEEAVTIANATRYGLSASVFGANLERAESVARRIDVGLVRVNAPTTGVDFHVPFGGEKASSYGPREQGRAAREFFTRSRTILVAGGPH